MPSKDNKINIVEHAEGVSESAFLPRQNLKGEEHNGLGTGNDCQAFVNLPLDSVNVLPIGVAGPLSAGRPTLSSSMRPVDVLRTTTDPSIRSVPSPRNSAVWLALCMARRRSAKRKSPTWSSCTADRVAETRFRREKHRASEVPQSYRFRCRLARALRMLAELGHLLERLRSSGACWHQIRRRRRPRQRRRFVIPNPTGEEPL